MTSRETVRGIIEAVLSDHRAGPPFGGTVKGAHCRCSCGEPNFVLGSRDAAAAKARAHVAAAIADRLREVRE